MKSIEQLLELSKNPYYTFTNDEKAVLEDFFLQKKERDSMNLPERNLPTTKKNTPVRVRNIVEKTIPQVPDANEPGRIS